MPEYCNRGIGTTLLRGLQSETAAAGKPLRIHVERFNPALRLYQRLGFRQIDDRGEYLFMEWKGDNSQCVCLAGHAPESKTSYLYFDRGFGITVA